MGKQIQLSGTAISLDPGQVEPQVENTTKILPLDLIKLLEETNTSNILYIDFTTTRPEYNSTSVRPFFDDEEKSIIVSKNHIIPSYTPTEDYPQEINNSEVLSFELRDYDQESVEFKIVLEFFNETGGVF